MKNLFIAALAMISLSCASADAARVFISPNGTVIGTRDHFGHRYYNYQYGYYPNRTGYVVPYHYYSTRPYYRVRPIYKSGLQINVPGFRLNIR